MIAMLTPILQLLKRKGLLLLPLASSIATAQVCQETYVDLNKPEQYSLVNASVVLDKTTGLMWQKCSVGQQSITNCSGKAKRYTFKQAEALLQQQNRINLSGFADWRLPTLNELRTLQKSECMNPTIDSHFFPGTPAEWYWTSSRSGYVTHYAFDFANGYTSKSSNVYKDKLLLRLVRG